MSAEVLEDSNYPFDTGDWDSWTIVEQRDWLLNFITQLTKDDNRLARELGLSSEQLRPFQEQLAIHENAVAAERAERKAYAELLQAQHDLATAEQFLSPADKQNSNNNSPSPDLRPGKKGN